MDNKIRYRVPIDPACPTSKYVIIYVNGKPVEIERNVSLDLNEEYVKILEESQIRVEQLAEDNTHISGDDNVRSII